VSEEEGNGGDKMQESNSYQVNIKDWIGKTVKELYPEMISWRRDFHRYPETGWTEYRTSAKIADLLETWGWDVYLGEEVVVPSLRMGIPLPHVLERCEERARKEGVSSSRIEKMKGGLTGVIAEWKTAKDSPVFVFRFDIDCNDLQEATNTDHIPVKDGFSSMHEGCMLAGTTVIPQLVLLLQNGYPCTRIGAPLKEQLG
jgi:aminobenzoyl-glutamate utilization protein A